MKKYYLLAFSLALILAGASTPAMAQGKAVNTAATENARVSFTFLAPQIGTVLKAGRQVEVTWDMSLDRVMTQNEWAEMELVLESDEGLEMRISPQMSVSKRTFTWTVPNISTQTARLVMQCGIEGEGERYRFVQSGNFTIKALPSEPSIFLDGLQRGAKPGQNMDISWTTSNLSAGTSYDVMVSYDRGAHFHKAGSTVENRFSLPVDADFAGAISVQIAARSSNGSIIKSFMTKSATVRINDSEID